MRHRIRKPRMLFEDRIIYEYYMSMLKGKRILRFLKRCFLNSKIYVLVAIIIVSFEVALIPLGINWGKYLTYMDGVWDMRFIFLTSIILPITVGIISSENKHHNNLVMQHEVYKNFLYASTYFIKSISELINVPVDTDIFDAFENVEMYKIKCKRNSSTVCEMNSKMKLEKAFNQYISALADVMKYLEISNFVGFKLETQNQLRMLKEELESKRIELKDIIENQEGNVKYVEDFLTDIVLSIFYCIAALRRPWRWDQARDKKIKEFMSNHEL